MGKRLLTPQKLMKHLERQFGFVVRSVELFDDGQTDEATRLAATLRVLLHDSNTSHSLLGQLGVKTTMRYWDTARYVDDIEAAVARFDAARDDGSVLLTLPTPGLLVPDLSASPPRWVAPGADSAGVWTPFNRWWKRPMMISSSGHQFSRWDLVRVMANQDGGAHIDPKIDEDYDDLETETFGIQFAPGGDWTESEPPDGWQPMLSEVAAECVRQVAFEIAVTLGKKWRQLIEDPNWEPPADASQDVRDSWLIGGATPVLISGVPTTEPKFERGDRGS